MRLADRMSGYGGRVISLLTYQKEGQYHLYYRERNELVLFEDEEWTEYIINVKDQFYETDGISVQIVSEELSPVLFVDEQLNVIKTERVRNGKLSCSVGSKTVYIVIAVKDADKSEVNLCGRLSAKGERELEDEKTKRLTEAFEGKSMSVLGDSISSFENYIPEGYLTYYPVGNVELEDTWWYLTAKKTGMNICKINSCAGSGVTELVGDGVKAEMSAANGRGRKLHSGGQYPDVIFVWIGANDIMKGQSEAEIDAAYRRMMQDITESYPEAEIYLCNYFYCIVDHLDQNAWLDQEIREVADDFQAKVLDLKTCGITPENQTEYLYDMQDETMLGAHPNKEGFALITECIVKQLAEFR